MSVTSIEWTKRPGTIGETWNPTTGCNKVDRGCKYCYAEIMHRRLMAMGQEKYKQPFLEGAVSHESTLEIPLKWTKPRTVFVNSMSDLFHKDVQFTFIDKVFNIMYLTPQHTYLILTKRPERAAEFWKWMESCSAGAWKCPPNVWMGTSANDQISAEIRVPELLRLDGCLRFLSYEPATGPLDLTKIIIRSDNLDEDGYQKKYIGINALDGIASEWVTDRGEEVYREIFTRDNPRLNWVICGGESGPKADPMDPDWPRKVRDHCKESGVPFFFKQWGRYKPITDLFMNIKGMEKSKDKSYNVLDEEVIQQYPK